MFNDSDEIAEQRGIATEPYIDEFIEKVGGKRLDTCFPNPAFLNADYIFENEKVIIELKIIETEFGETDSFKKKRKEIIREIAKIFPLGESIRWEKGPGEYYAKSMIELNRAPLARICTPSGPLLNTFPKHVKEIAFS